MFPISLRTFTLKHTFSSFTATLKDLVSDLCIRGSVSNFHNKRQIVAKMNSRVKKIYLSPRK